MKYIFKLLFFLLIFGIFSSPFNFNFSQNIQASAKGFSPFPVGAYVHNTVRTFTLFSNNATYQGQRSPKLHLFRQGMFVTHLIL
jgi:hypothetical protein